MNGRRAAGRQSPFPDYGAPANRAGGLASDCCPATIAATMNTTLSARLDQVSLGFRERFLSYDELTRQVQAWANAFPDLCRATSIGRTPEGRDLWLLTLGPDPDRPRPSAWVDGN